MDVETGLHDDEINPVMKRSHHSRLATVDAAGGHSLVEGVDVHDTQDTEQHTENENSMEDHEPAELVEPGEEAVEDDAEIAAAVGEEESGDQTPIYCILCDAEIRGKWAYRKHIIKHQEAAQRGQDPTEELLVPFNQNKQEESPLTYTLRCTVCSFVTNVPRDLEKHYHTHFVGYRCLLCKFTTLHRTRLAAHYPLHKKERARFECRMCGATLSSTSALKKHVARHSEGTICCSMCEYKTYDQFLLREHLATKHNEVRKKYKCEHCDKEFGTFKRFFQHRQEAHKGFVYKRQVDPKICDRCDFQSTKVKEMNAHKLSHQGMVDVLPNGRYLCRIQGCSDTFSSATKYEMHFTKVHDKNNIYGLRSERGRSCKVEGCSFTTVRESHLKLHMRVHRTQQTKGTDLTEGGETAQTATHVAPPPAKAEKKKRAQGTCHICMAKFSDKYKVRSHIETVHSNLKPHECDMCCYRTAYKYNMKIHMKKLHNTEYGTTAAAVAATAMKGAVEAGLDSNQALATFQDQVAIGATTAQAAAAALGVGVVGMSAAPSTVTFLQTAPTTAPAVTTITVPGSTSVTGQPAHEQPDYQQEYESGSEYEPEWTTE
ncbi:telomere zinc finger-associated protein-like [Varroa jacobsoni]|uniref:telomere zinc finger-associated protein-like n=1 Tax=Varroa jacobsoni TaxID=62625 RepID=UPI000BF798BA|nr:telomere zinc finger-associated protein-like [Varroa jacobsoni]XP_022708828.1 telomere zinc finger-associated protein-like [Varroa jacobsoni]XP_022708829.1 telomere zinc finger-associated protein-like [Varroa jacobsoni]